MFDSDSCVRMALLEMSLYRNVLPLCLLCALLQWGCSGCYRRVDCYIYTVPPLQWHSACVLLLGEEILNTFIYSCNAVLTVCMCNRSRWFLFHHSCSSCTCRKPLNQHVNDVNVHLYTVFLIKFKTIQTVEETISISLIETCKSKMLPQLILAKYFDSNKLKF